jgi:hypothetical protein
MSEPGVGRVNDTRSDVTGSLCRPLTTVPGGLRGSALAQDGHDLIGIPGAGVQR